MARPPQYTVARCEAELERIEDLIAEISAIPTQQGGDGIYASFSGRLADLRKERGVWEGRLEKAQAYEEPVSGSSLQGPSYTIH